MIYRIVHAVVLFVYKIMYRLHIVGRQNIPPGAMLICANHTSMHDPVLLALALGGKKKPNYMAKAELFRVPVFSALIKSLGAFPVERGSGDVKAIKKSLELLKNGGRLIVFPEGGRIRDADKGEAKTGAGMLAVRTGVEVLPVYITPGGKRIFSRVDVIIGKPMIFTHDRQAGSAQYRQVADAIMDSVRALKPEEKKK